MKTYGNETSQTLAAKYLQCSTDLAILHGKMSEIRNTLKHLMDVSNDNGDPYFKALDAFTEMGEALSATLCYYKEYQDEAQGIDVDQEDQRS